MVGRVIAVPGAVIDPVERLNVNAYPVSLPDQSHVGNDLDFNRHHFVTFKWCVVGFAVRVLDRVVGRARHINLAVGHLQPALREWVIGDVHPHRDRAGVVDLPALLIENPQADVNVHVFAGRGHPQFGLAVTREHHVFFHGLADERDTRLPDF